MINTFSIILTSLIFLIVLPVVHPYVILGSASVGIFSVVRGILGLVDHKS